MRGVLCAIVYTADVSPWCQSLHAVSAASCAALKAFAITARDALVQVAQFDMVAVLYFDRDARLVLVS